MDEALNACILCPRSCAVDRGKGARGYCGQTASVRVARSALHHWEEPPISGNSGSGTVFFSGCPLKCAYCQNASIAQGDVGVDISIERLSQLFLEQQERGALNINLVTPTQFAPQIAEALHIARRDGLCIPIVYNTSGYEREDALSRLSGLVDIYLTDFKYASAQLASKYSNAPDYPEIASRSLDHMFAQVGPFTLGADPRPIRYRTEREEDVLHKGVIVRHLVLPGQVSDSFKILKLLAAKPYRHDIWISLMSQYTPMPGIEQKYPELSSSVDSSDYDAVVDYALAIGLENLFVQEEGAVGESFIPDFDFEGIL